MTTKAVRVADLELGQVISMPKSGLEPAWIQGILTGPKFRNLRLVDLESGQPLTNISSLGSHRMVQLHDVTAEVLAYTNVTDEPVETVVGNRLEVVDPAETIHEAVRSGSGDVSALPASSPSASSSRAEQPLPGSCTYTCLTKASLGVRGLISSLALGGRVEVLPSEASLRDLPTGKSARVARRKST